MVTLFITSVTKSHDPLSTCPVTLNPKPLGERKVDPLDVYGSVVPRSG